jgi:hypothetical protein
MRSSHFRTKRTQLECTSPSLTKQSFRDECDINALMRRWSASGDLSNVLRSFELENGFRASYGDYTGVQSYHESLNRVLAAENAFMQLPSSLRERFRNDPGEFLAFVQDPANERELQTLGLRTDVPMSDVAAGSENKEGALAECGKGSGNQCGKDVSKTDAESN